MRTYNPIVIFKNKAIKYPKLDIEKSIEFGSRFKKRSPNITVFFETFSEGTIEKLSLKQLIEFNSF